MSSSTLSAAMNLRIGGIPQIGLFLILNFSSILKREYLTTDFLLIGLSFTLLVFLDSPLNSDIFWFLKLKNPFRHSKVMGIFVILKFFKYVWKKGGGLGANYF